MARTREQVISDCFATGEVQFEENVIPSAQPDSFPMQTSVNQTRANVARYDERAKLQDKRDALIVIAIIVFIIALDLVFTM